VLPCSRGLGCAQLPHSGFVLSPLHALCAPPAAAASQPFGPHSSLESWTAALWQLSQCTCPSGLVTFALIVGSCALPLQIYAATVMTSGFAGVGGKFYKSVYRQYTDSSFKVRLCSVAQVLPASYSLWIALFSPPGHDVLWTACWVCRLRPSGFALCAGAGVHALDDAVGKLFFARCVWATPI
jgi:hypothetical protein